jgi:hypothetical protein
LPQDALNRIVLDPSNRDLLAIVKGARNGAVYGAKVRFPHALVMVFLFRSGTFRQKVDLVFRATRTHARNLAKFATIYKTVCYLLKWYGSTPGKEGESSVPFRKSISNFCDGWKRRAKGTERHRRADQALTLNLQANMTPSSRD